MTLAAGDPVLLSSVNTTNGSGSFITFGAGTSSVFWNSGSNSSSSPSLLREVAPGTSGLFGKCVQLTNKSTTYRGAVIAVLQVELDTTGGNGSLTECVLVQADAGFRFLAKVTEVTEVPC